MILLKHYHIAEVEQRDTPIVSQPIALKGNLQIERKEPFRLVESTRQARSPNNNLINELLQLHKMGTYKIEDLQLIESRVVPCNSRSLPSSSMFQGARGVEHARP